MEKWLRLVSDSVLTSKKGVLRGFFRGHEKDREKELDSIDSMDSMDSMGLDGTSARLDGFAPGASCTSCNNVLLTKPPTLHAIARGSSLIDAASSLVTLNVDFASDIAAIRVPLLSAQDLLP